MAQRVGKTQSARKIVADKHVVERGMPQTTYDGIRMFCIVHRYG
jgi:hypothetical protein